MRRRRLLKYAGISTAVGLTGCLGQGKENPDNGTDNGENDGNTDYPTTVTDTSLSVVAIGNRADAEGVEPPGVASFRFDGKNLSIQGTAIGSDPCKTVELESAVYDGEQGDIIVNVNTVTSGDAGDCEREEPTPIKYELTVEFEGEKPGVTVRHDGEEVDARPEERGEANLKNTEFEVTGSECGTMKNEVEYIREQGMSETKAGSKGTVIGTIWGPDSCATAELGYVSYDRKEDALVADVRTASEDKEGCADCITEVEYKLTAEFEGGIADSAAVSHDGVRTDALESGGVESAEFTVEGREGAGSEDEDAKPEFDEDGGSIVVDGRIVGNDGCAVARLAEAYVEDSELKVDVETVHDGSDICTEALVAIDYTAVLRFDGDIPNNASVSHNGREFTGASYASKSVSPSDSER